jgi:hypothetical protein
MQTRLWIEVAPEGEAVTVGVKGTRTEVAAMMVVAMVVVEGTEIGEVVIAGGMGRGGAVAIKADGAVATAGDSAGVIGAAGDAAACPFVLRARHVTQALLARYGDEEPGWRQNDYGGQGGRGGPREDRGDRRGDRFHWEPPTEEVRWAWRGRVENEGGRYCPFDLDIFCEVIRQGVTRCVGRCWRASRRRARGRPL